MIGIGLIELTISYIAPIIGTSSGDFWLAALIALILEKLLPSFQLMIKSPIFRNRSRVSTVKRSFKQQIRFMVLAKTSNVFKTTNTTEALLRT